MNFYKAKEFGIRVVRYQAFLRRVVLLLGRRLCRIALPVSRTVAQTVTILCIDVIAFL